MIVVGVGLFFMILISLSFVSAGIYFSNIESRFNLGDMIDLNVQVNPIVDGYLLKTELICGESSVIVFNNFPDEEGNINIKLPLNEHTIKEVSGDCYFLSEYSGDIRKSSNFEISKRLIVNLNSESFFANPGEEIVILGSAERLNGALVNGEVELSIPLLSLFNQINSEESETDESEDEESESEENISDEEIAEEIVNIDIGKFYGKVVEGEFSLIFNLPEDTPAGDYRIDVLVYEESFNQRASEGVVMANLKIFQILKNIDIALNNQNFNPGTNFEFKPVLLDQTGVSVEDEVSIVIKNEDSERVFEKIVKSQETVQYNIPSDLTAGYYNVEASNGDIEVIKTFYINEKAIVSFEIINNSLIVTNIGNIPYKKDIEVELNGKPFVKKIDLKLGESAEFKLTGSNEEYNVKVSDGESEISQGGVMLTGHSVNVDAINEGGVVGALTSPIVWIFLIVILGVGLLFLLRNVFKKKSFAYAFSGKFRKKNKDIELEKGDEKSLKGKDEGKVAPGALVPPSQAEQVLVLKGHKTNASVIVLKIKNKIGKNEKQSLEKAIENVYEIKGAVYEQGDFIFIIFSPIMTRTTKNEIEAAKAAEKIELVLKEHNKKFKDKINFGIAINSGEIINKVEDKKLKFTALGNFIMVAKRLAEASNKQILVTKESYEKGISEMKAEKRKIAGGDVYELRQVLDSKKNQKFIQGFLERIGKG